MPRRNPITGTWMTRKAHREMSCRAMDRHIAEGLKLPPSQVTRFEVIDETGRAYVKLSVQVELSYQDDGRTLKVFVTPRGRVKRKSSSEVLEEIVKRRADLMKRLAKR